MREFDRIVTDYRNLGGLPHFRDTSITVSEVVRMAMGGKPNADILVQYPDLEPGDIQEALAYIVTNLVQNIGMTRFEMAGRLSSIFGAIEILSELGDLDDEEQERLLQTCRQSIEPATRIIYQLQNWSHYTCFGVLEGVSSASMSEILDEFRDNLAPQDTEFDIVAPVMLPQVQGDNLSLLTALRALTTGDLIGRSKDNAQIEVRQANDHLVFTIRRTFLESPKDFSSFVEQFQATGNYPNDLAIAALIIHQHGSELKTTPDDKGVRSRSNSRCGRATKHKKFIGIYAAARLCKPAYRTFVTLTP